MNLYERNYILNIKNIFTYGYFFRSQNNLERSYFNDTGKISQLICGRKLKDWELLWLFAGNRQRRHINQIP